MATRSRAEELLKALGNPVRLRVILALEELGEATLYRISSRTGVKRTRLRRHLETLVSSGICLRKVHGDVLLYSLNLKDEGVKTFVEALRELLRRP